MPTNGFAALEQGYELSERVREPGVLDERPAVVVDEIEAQDARENDESERAGG
jgi:hypothetical protein